MPLKSYKEQVVWPIIYCPQPNDKEPGIWMQEPAFTCRAWRGEYAVERSLPVFTYQDSVDLFIRERPELSGKYHSIALLEEEVASYLETHCLKHNILHVAVDPKPSGEATTILELRGRH
jgi:hypothetical protein